MKFATLLTITLAVSTSLAACGSDSSGAAPAAGGAAGAGGDAQTPPQGAASVEAWLKTGAYQKWHCEAAIHASRMPSPHGFNRICSNDLLAATATGDWPQGAAGVKELYASATDTVPKGYAVYLKTKAVSAGGANWYWYERDGGVVADGMGDSGSAKSICVGCHAGAGSDAGHTPTVGGRDLVYTPVP